MPMQWDFHHGDIPGAVKAALDSFVHTIRATRRDAPKRMEEFKDALAELKGTVLDLSTRFFSRLIPLLRRPAGLSQAIENATAAIAEFGLPPGDALVAECRSFFDGIRDQWCAALPKGRAAVQWGFVTEENNPFSVVCFPVEWERKENGELIPQGGLHYICAFPGGDVEWDFRGFNLALYQRHRLLDELARVAIGIVAKVEPKFVVGCEVEKLCRSYAFRLLNDGSVEQGKSHTGAVTVILLICYLLMRLGVNAQEMTYDPASVISLEIDPNTGECKGVGGLPFKIAAAARFWATDVAGENGSGRDSGRGLRFYVAKSDQNLAEQILNALAADLPVQREECVNHVVHTVLDKGRAEAIRQVLAQKIPGADQCQVIGCTNAEDLASHILGGLKLKLAHDKWVELLTSSEFDSWKGRLPAESVNHRNKLAQGIASSTNYSETESGVLYSTGFSGLTHQVVLGVSPLAFQEDRDLARKRALVFAIAADDERLWPHENEISPAAELIYEVAKELRGIDALGTNTSIFAHLLSEGTPALEIGKVVAGSRPLDPTEIDRTLRAFRSEAGKFRTERGQFFRPIAESWIQRAFSFDIVELFVVAYEQPLDFPDYFDGDNSRHVFFSWSQIEPGSAKQAAWLERNNSQLLPFWKDNHLNHRLIRSKFGKPARTIRKATIHCGSICPIRWGGAPWKWTLVNRVKTIEAGNEERDFVLIGEGQECVAITPRFETFAKMEAAELEVSVVDREHEQDDPPVSPSGQHQEHVSDHSRNGTGSFTVPFHAQKLPVWDQLAGGKLSSDELADIQCNGFAAPGGGLVPKPSLSAMRGPYEAMQPRDNRLVFFVVDGDSGEWWFSDSGCEVNDGQGAVVLCEGHLMYVDRNSGGTVNFKTDSTCGGSVPPVKHVLASGRVLLGHRFRVS